MEYMIEAALPLLDGEELGIFMGRLREAIMVQFPGLEVYPLAIYGDAIVVRLCRHDDSGMEEWQERIPFSRRADGQIALGTGVRVAARFQTVYEPVELSAEAAPSPEHRILTALRPSGRMPRAS